MIVAAPERRQHPADNAKRTPIQPDFGQSRPHQRADENQIAAIFGAEQLDRLADLPDRNPVMAKARHGHRVAGAFQCEHDAADAARGQRSPRPQTA